MFQILDESSGGKPSITISGDQEIALPNFCKLKKTPNPTRVHLMNGFFRSLKVPWKSDIFDNKKYYKAHSWQLKNVSASELLMPLEFIINSKKFAWEQNKTALQQCPKQTIRPTLIIQSISTPSLSVVYLQITWSNYHNLYFSVLRDE